MQIRDILRNNVKEKLARDEVVASMTVGSSARSRSRASQRPAASTASTSISNIPACRSTPAARSASPQWKQA